MLFGFIMMTTAPLIWCACPNKEGVISSILFAGIGAIFFALGILI